MINVVLHIADLLHWRVAFGVILFAVLICIAVYTLYKTYRRILEHNKMAEKLRETATHSIRMKALTQLLLDKTQTHVWELKDGMFSVLQFDSKTLDAVIPIEEMRNLVTASAFYKHRVEEFFQIEEPGNHVIQMYGSFEGRDPHWYELSMMVEQTPQGLVRRGSTVMIDQLKKREAMELDPNRMLANAKEKDDFISCMSHEIRTPLNAIVGISELLANMRQTLTQEEIAYFEREISKNNVLLMKMIEDMLTITLIDNSGITVQYEDLRYSDCLSDLSIMREDEGLALFGLKIEVVENGEDVPIRVDKNLFRRIMNNIFDNAAKFSPMGSTVTVTRTVTDKEMILSIKDQGIGIDPQYHNLIFTRFYKIDHFSQGAGLGLALCKELADYMGAKITVESELGKGSTFNLIFKRADK
jgi:signal transduction histidine kinase